MRVPVCVCLDLKELRYCHDQWVQIVDCEPFSNQVIKGLICDQTLLVKIPSRAPLGQGI